MSSIKTFSQWGILLVVFTSPHNCEGIGLKVMVTSWKSHGIFFPTLCEPWCSHKIIMVLADERSGKKKLRALGQQSLRHASASS